MPFQFRFLQTAVTCCLLLSACKVVNAPNGAAGGVSGGTATGSGTSAGVGSSSGSAAGELVGGEASGGGEGALTSGPTANGKGYGGSDEELARIQDARIAAIKAIDELIAGKSRENLCLSGLHGGSSLLRGRLNFFNSNPAFFRFFQAHLKDIPTLLSIRRSLVAGNYRITEDEEEVTFGGSVQAAVTYPDEIVFLLSKVGPMTDSELLSLVIHEAGHTEGYVDGTIDPSYSLFFDGRQFLDLRAACLTAYSIGLTYDPRSDRGTGDFYFHDDMKGLSPITSKWSMFTGNLVYNPLGFMHMDGGAVVIGARPRNFRVRAFILLPVQNGWVHLNGRMENALNTYLLAIGRPPASNEVRMAIYRFDSVYGEQYYNLATLPSMPVNAYYGNFIFDVVENSLRSYYNGEFMDFQVDTRFGGAGDIGLRLQNAIVIDYKAYNHKP